VTKGWFEAPTAVEVWNSKAPCDACGVYVVTYRLRWLKLRFGVCDNCAQAVRAASKVMSRLVYNKYIGRQSPRKVRRLTRAVKISFAVGVVVGALVLAACIGVSIEVAEMIFLGG